MANNTTSLQDKAIESAEYIKDYVPVVASLLSIIEDLDAKLTEALWRLDVLPND